MTDNKYHHFLMTSAFEKKDSKDDFFDISEVKVPKQTSDKIKLLMESLDITVDLAINISISYAIYMNGLNDLDGTVLEDSDFELVPFDINLKNLGKIKEVVGDKGDGFEIICSKCVINSVDILCKKLSFEVIPPKHKMRIK